ncbi:MAG: glycosyltransferase family 4 protein [Tunicatimonas sp.]
MDGFASEKPVQIVKLATSGHPPHDTRIFHKEAKTLAEAGYLVTYIVPRGDTNQTETVDGVTLVPVRYPRGGAEKLLITPLRILRQALRFSRRAIIHLHDSELLFIGLTLRLLGRRVIYDAHEDTPLQISYQHWIPAWLKPLYQAVYFALEKAAGRWFQRIIVAEPVIERHFPPGKTTLLRNFPIIAPFRTATQHPPPRLNQVLYIGSVTEVRGFREMMAACERANQHQPFTFIIAGSFHPASLEAEFKRAQNTRFLGRLSLDQVAALNAESKVGLIVPHPITRYKTNYPVKLFEYWAAGLPVVASEHGEIAKFVEQCQGGIVVNPLDARAISDAIVYLLTHEDEARAMGQRGQQMVFEQYSWEVERPKLLALYAPFGA